MATPDPTTRSRQPAGLLGFPIVVTLGILLGVALSSTASRAQEWKPGWQPESDSWLSSPRAVEPVIAVPAAPPTEFSARRAALAAALVASAADVATDEGASEDERLAVWVPARSFDELDPFFQDDDFLYLSGCEIPDVALLMVVDADGALVQDTLYLPAKDPFFELWNGARLAPGPEAAALTGFASTAELAATADAWTDILAATGASRVLVLADPPWTTPEGMQLVVGGGRDPAGLRSTLSRLRLVKSDYEIACLQAAIDITCAALRNAVAEVRPGAWEFQAQGALEGTYLRLGSERPGFASIFGSGPNSVTLHYNSNRRQMQAGELMVMDVGSKYRYYCADVSRTVPVSGRFTDRQREVYDIVLAAQTAAAEAARPGMTIKDLDDIARKVIEDAGYERKHFPHSVGHWIGLDVHDVGGRVPIEIGSLFTIEPGIYIAEENLGVRIEDDYLMTADGAVKLSVGIPSDPDALEALLASRS